MHSSVTQLSRVVLRDLFATNPVSSVAAQLINLKRQLHVGMDKPCALITLIGMHERVARRVATPHIVGRHPTAQV